MQGRKQELENATRIYLSVGSNLGDREDNLRRAIASLAPKVLVDRVSSIYATEPVGVTDQPEFLNLTVSAETALKPEDLLNYVKDVESAIGREPTFRWGPRVIDIDILLYGELQLESEELTIPHPEMGHRAFVLVPLAEIAPRAVDPTSGLTMSRLLEQVDGKQTVHFYRRPVRGDVRSEK